MGTALVVVALPAGLFLLLLSLPIDVAFRLKGIEALDGQVSIRWLFGLVRFSVRVPDATGPQAPDLPGAPPPASRPVKREPRRARTNALAVLRDVAFRRRAYRLLADLVGALHVRELGLRLRLGLGDPADTGRLWAFVGPLAAAAQQWRLAELRLEPDFAEPVFEFDARGRFLIVPIRLLALAVAFALSPVTIRAWRTSRAGHA